MVTFMTTTGSENTVNRELEKLRRECQVKECCSDPLTKVEGLAYLVLIRPDIEKAAKFFVDYGLLLDIRTEKRIYLRGVSAEHHLIIIEKGPQALTTIGLKASEGDVQRLAHHYDQTIQAHPTQMGGQYVSLKDPDGLVVEVNCNLSTLLPIDKVPCESNWNTGDEKTRKNESVRNVISPVTVRKLGHSLHSVANIKKTVHWYQDTFGFIVSDFQFLPGDENPIVVFMRVDRGEVPTDHHTLGFGITPELGHIHSAFEMDTFEEVAVAGHWMSKRASEMQYKHGWGIGRHILGSQVFDYWRDPYGDLFEHYADGDLFNREKNTGYHLFNGSAQHQWGPDMTAEFKGLNRPWNTFKSVLRRIPSNDDLSIRRLAKMIKAI